MTTSKIIGIFAYSLRRYATSMNMISKLEYANVTYVYASITREYSGYNNIGVTVKKLRSSVTLREIRLIFTR